MLCGEGTLASPSSCSREPSPPPSATQASPPHIHPAPAPTEQPHPCSFFPSFFLNLTLMGRWLVLTLWPTLMRSLLSGCPAQVRLAGRQGLVQPPYRRRMWSRL